MSDHTIRCPADIVTTTTLADGRIHPMVLRCEGELPIPVTPGFTIRSARCTACGAWFETGRSKNGHVWYSATGPEMVQ